jgi:WD40-like Beta Propeller Repeat
MRVVKLVAVAGFLAPGLLAGQRHPVLRQIMVPHSYYYREMYLPQVTSGPSAVTWSPDGRELIYSMQGSLWRQRIGSTEARQLTSGRGYDFQPDWSPDGDRLVYVSYRNDAIELRLLELRTGETADLLSNGAVTSSRAGLPTESASPTSRTRRGTLTCCTRGSWRPEGPCTPSCHLTGSRLWGMVR